MPITDAQIRTITRTTENGPESVSFNPTVKEEVDNLPEWAKALTTTDVVLRTIACEGVDEKGNKCPNTTTFNPNNQEEVASLPDWVRTFRMINLGNGARFAYCSDICEVNGVTTGNHNVPEPKRVEEATAADASKVIAAHKAAQAMKKGKS